MHDTSPYQTEIDDGEPVESAKAPHNIRIGMKTWSVLSNKYALSRGATLLI